jgi:mannosyltransferase
LGCEAELTDDQPAGMSAMVCEAMTQTTRQVSNEALGQRLPAKYGLHRYAPGLSAGVALAAGLWQLARLSYTQDEAATLSATRRPFGAMLALLGHIDAVHGTYYLLMHLVVKLGISPEIVRMPSVLAMAVAAWYTAVLGIELSGNLPGLAAGLLFALSPLTTEYAQDARPFAMVTCLAVLASYRFVIFARSGTRRDACWYGAALAACGFMNVFGLLIIAGHAVTLAASPVRRDRLRWFGCAAGAAVIVTSPLVGLAATQVGQVGWERKPGPLVVLAVLVALAGAGFLAWRSARRPAITGLDSAPMVDAFGSAALIKLSAPWLIVPVAFLVLASQIPLDATSNGSPGSGIWEPRYLLFCLPALILLATGLASRLPPRAATVLIINMIVISAVAQPLARPKTSPDDIRAVAALLEARSRPGDAIVFPEIAKRLIKDAYPAGFSRLRDVGLDSSPAARNSLYGLNVSQTVLWRRLASVERLWVVIFPVTHPSLYFAREGRPYAFCLSSSWRFPLNMVLLYQRCKP